MYAENTIFEIHACSKGQWKTLGTFSDANQAIAEAVRLRCSRRYAGIRVTEESFQDTVGKFASRVVYRYALEKRDDSVTVDAEPALAGTRSGPSNELDGLTRAPQAMGEAPIESEALVPMLATRLGVVIIAGVLLLMAIHSL